MDDTQNVSDLEEAQNVIRNLRQKLKVQAQQLANYRRAYKMQDCVLARLQREKADQLKLLSSKLLLFESRLLRKQKDISLLLTHRENIIHHQQKIIENLTGRLIENGLDCSQIDFEQNRLDLESLNDSDSAVVLEDMDSDCTFTSIPKLRTTNYDSVTVMRSVSDAFDPSSKYASRRSNCFLRRPEILETVYSVEEDADSSECQSQEKKSDVNKKRDAFASQKNERIVPKNDDLLYGFGSSECTEMRHQESERPTKLTKSTDDSAMESTNKCSNQVTTYNRVMLNHRSVTKPKDVKYKRINKAKSKSLEELRGKLKSWVEHGTKVNSFSAEHG
ncbi:uncharacterized protein LOC108741179 [Agrilus planipennis]|uniref:Uncharacterized protein LOC108741179 n=1 Tax=Agrilus planipennis TaxID=224129 RepID=A0A1W4XG99_AGRPL|nr:uncharacterized protein LOC108741179 [Agrilus planipennis]XP_018331368.1 uncharacterized protein LOC108741179 [Agrilus planipennis]XP_018331370.1 uncharacterized protein LOC108741179 [Agrilus planipennis]